MSGDVRAKFVSFQILTAQLSDIQHMILLFFIPQQIYAFLGIKEGTVLLLEQREDFSPCFLSSAYKEIASNETDPNIPAPNPMSPYQHSIYFRKHFVQRMYMEITPDLHVFYGILKQRIKEEIDAEEQELERILKEMRSAEPDTQDPQIAYLDKVYAHAKELEKQFEKEWRPVSISLQLIEREYQHLEQLGAKRNKSVSQMIQSYIHHMLLP